MTSRTRTTQSVDDCGLLNDSWPHTEASRQAGQACRGTRPLIDRGVLGINPEGYQSISIIYTIINVIEERNCFYSTTPYSELNWVVTTDWCTIFYFTIWFSPRLLSSKKGGTIKRLPSASISKSTRKRKRFKCIYFFNNNEALSCNIIVTKLCFHSSCRCGQWMWPPGQIIDVCLSFHRGVLAAQKSGEPAFSDVPPQLCWEKASRRLSNSTRRGLYAWPRMMMISSPPRLLHAT